MYDRTILFLNFHPSQLSKVQSIALPETPVTVVSFTSLLHSLGLGIRDIGPHASPENIRTAISISCCRGPTWSKLRTMDQEKRLRRDFTTEITSLKEKSKSCERAEYRKITGAAFTDSHGSHELYSKRLVFSF